MTPDAARLALYLEVYAERHGAPPLTLTEYQTEDTPA